MPFAWSFGQQGFQAALLITTADPPDGGPVAVQVVGQGLAALPPGNAQYGPRPLDLKPRQSPGMGDLFEDPVILARDRQWIRFSATHRMSPIETEWPCLRLRMVASEFVALLMSRATSG